MTADTFGCVKNTIRLRSGRYFDYVDPQPDQFVLSDISGALSKICRFGGHCRQHYSVAEHLVHCAAVADQDGFPREVQLAVFMHDAAEAFTGDCVKPLKVMLPQFAVVEAAVEAVIASKYGIDFEAHKRVVQEIDHAMLIAERRWLFSADNVEWAGEKSVRKLSIPFRCWTHERAESQFLQVAQILGLPLE